MRKVCIFILKFYRNYLSPFKLRVCRFHPTCSEYAIECYEKFGMVLGSFKTIKRILKCHPFHKGGYDPVR